MKKVIDFLRMGFTFRKRKPVKTLRMEVFLNNVVTSQCFAKMSLQEKLLSLGKLIELFHKDYGFTPKALENLVKSLNRKLNKEMLALWQESYTTYFDSRKTA